MTDVSVVMTFHDEGTVAKQSLNSMSRCIDAAAKAGISTEIVAVLDRATAETCRIVNGHPGVRVLTVDNGDQAKSRNDGIVSSSGRYVAIVDGDDYCSANWLAVSVPEAAQGIVLRHEWVVSFGEQEEFVQQVSQDHRLFDRDSLLVYNPYVCSCIAPRELFDLVPFHPSHFSRTGYGFEDWHWLCETVAAGARNVVVPGTALFYRRKPAGVLAKECAGRALIAPSALFSPKGHPIVREGGQG